MTKADRISLKSLLDSPRHQEKIVELAIAIRKGAIFVYPAETIYGIGGMYKVPGVAEKILGAKKRSLDNPMILLAPDLKFFSSLNLIFPSAARRLARSFWPHGLLTMVLPASEEPRGIAIRVSHHPLLQTLFMYIDKPLYSTSANVSGEPYVNDPDRIFALFSENVDFMIDAGALPPSAPSTVVKIDEKDTVTILREGAVSSQRIFEVLE
jgi:L-threonylcarbamoyladenylate synthase